MGQFSPECFGYTKDCSQFADGDAEVHLSEMTCPVSRVPPVSIFPALSRGLAAATCRSGTAGQKAVQISWAVPTALTQWRQSVKLTSALALWIQGG